MQLTPFVKRLIVAGATLILLIAVDASSRPTKSDGQANFELWLKQTTPLLGDAQESPTGVPLILAKINAVRAGQPIRWELSSSNDSPERNSQLVRLLELMREAAIFGKHSAEVPGPGTFSVAVEDAKTSFKANLTLHEVEESLPAKNLLKLFEVYASSDPSKTLAKNSAPSAAPVDTNSSAQSSLDHSNQNLDDPTNP